MVRELREAADPEALLHERMHAGDEDDDDDDDGGDDGDDERRGRARGRDDAAGVRRRARSEGLLSVTSAAALALAPQAVPALVVAVIELPVARVEPGRREVFGQLVGWCAANPIVRMGGQLLDVRIDDLVERLTGCGSPG